MKFHEPDPPEMAPTIHLFLKNTEAVDREVKIIVSSMFRNFDFTDYHHAFAAMKNLFSGNMPGYDKCDTPYHEWTHTLNILLATARLLHGIHISRQALSQRIVRITLLAALLHDSGYIKRNGECLGTGALFTDIHVKRSVDILEEIAALHEWTVDDIMDIESMIHCTDSHRQPDTIIFTNIEAMLAGHVLGTADIIGQMADDVYLERLPALYSEFSEGGITEYSSEFDLFRKTAGFYSFIRNKMETHLSSVIDYIPAHFHARHGVDRNLYLESIDRNIAYLTFILDEYNQDYAKGLRRGLDRRSSPLTLQITASSTEL